MDRTIEKLIELLNTHVVTSRGIKAIYNGRVKQVPIANFPAIIIKGDDFRSEILDTHRNQEVYSLQVLLAHDERKFVGADQRETTTEREVRKIFEERETGTNEFKADTILSVVLKEFMYTSTFNLNVTVEGLSFGEDLDDLFEVESPGFYGRLDLSITATPTRVKSA